jgi:hypothetical protein
VEEFYFVLEGVGRLRVSGETLTVPRYGGVLVGSDQLRQVFNDTDAEASSIDILVDSAPEIGKTGLCQMKTVVRKLLAAK